MLSPISQSVVRPLYNGGGTVLQGAQHHLLSMLLDTLPLLNTLFRYVFGNFNSICLSTSASEELTGTMLIVNGHMSDDFWVDV